MTIVTFGGIPVDSVGAVTLGAADALALGEGQALGLAVVVYVLGANADDTELPMTNHTMGHPFDLVHELLVALAIAAQAVLVHVFNSLDVFWVFFL